MNIQRATPVNELLAKLIFLILPTALVGYFLLWNANNYFAILQNGAVLQAGYLLAGMAASAIFYSLRFRFLPSFIALLAIFWAIYKGLDATAYGEFDAFFATIQFLVFAILFGAGWLIGWGFVRLRYWSIGMAAAILAGCILLIAKLKLDSVEALEVRFLPALAYAVYIIFTSEQIYNYKDKSQKFWWFLSRRLVLFALVAGLVLFGVERLMRGEIEETVANYGGGGKTGDNSLMKQNKDGTFDLKNYTRLQSSLGRSNELLFAAHIDNYFPGTDIPNPLYLTAFYYTKFDTATETFERDAKIPANDLFEPDPSKIPLFGTRVDSSVIKNSLADKLRKTVEIEVYSKKLSAGTYLAPHTGYFVQPITIEKDFRGEFKSAFRAKSYVSELNSAYFVYNAADNKQISDFQKQRFEILRQVKGFDGIDRRFKSYYTYMPRDPKWQRITQLTKEVTGKAITPVDKVLAIRDWFLSKDPATGKPLFKYTDNPGIPDIPSASKLQYFLFENRQGYCAYYAGATLFMLRSLGIPSRIAVGFLTVDRSDKNKGWYWYYADQAHAWVQVYFPGYGWLDFDTTVGNDDAQESPKPDGTPPMQPPRAYLAAEGTITDVDTVKKLVDMKIRQMVFHDKEYKLKAPITVSMAVKIAAIRRDSVDVPLANLRNGDDATAVSYAEAFKNFVVRNSDDGEKIISRWPKPAPIDEIYLKRKDVAKPEQKPAATETEETISVTNVLWTVAGIALGLTILFFLLPAIIFSYLRMRSGAAKNAGDKAYWSYRAAGFYLNQIGFFRNQLTPLQYAQRVVDTELSTKFGPFMIVYLKQKFAKQPLTPSETERVDHFLKPFLAQVRSVVPAKRRIGGFLNPARSFAFFSRKGDEDSLS